MTSSDSQLKKSIVRKYIEQIVNTGQVDNIADFIAPGYTEVYNEQRYELGIEGATDHVLGVRKTYPDLKLAVKQQICEGDWVATLYSMTGTHSGEWLGIKPTFKKIQVTGVNLDRIVDGKIIEHGGAANLLEPLLEIKAIKIVEENEE